MARVTRIRNLQELLGFSLAEVRTVLGTEDVDVLDRVRSELKAATLPARRRELLDEATVANDQLSARLDDTWAVSRPFATNGSRRGPGCGRLAEVRDQLATAAGDAGLAG